MGDLKSLLGDWPALSLRLDEALDLEPAARAAWVDALAEPPTFKRVLGELLAGAEPTIGGALEAPRLRLEPGDGEYEAAPVLVPGVRVGPYRLLRELGH